MKAQWIVLAALGALVVAGPGTALAGSARQTSNTTTFPDSIGENPAAPDITSIVVANDDAGALTFNVNISNRPALTPDMFVLIYLDTDKNPATGDAQSAGADYVIDLEAGSVSLAKWSGSDYVNAPSQTSLTYAYASTGATIKVSAADLGATKGFSFFAIAASGFAVDAGGNPDFTKVVADIAPDAGHGSYAYQVLTKVKLTVAGFRTVPNPAKAGGTFAAAFAATENDTGGPITQGTVTCRATVGGKSLAAKASGVANGVAVCAWKVPKTAKGKTLSGTVTVTVQGTTASRSFSVKVR